MLNAKFHELEAEIVAQAGQAGAVTIATNMAGRGTDIKLDDVAREAGGLKMMMLHARQAVLKSSVQSVMSQDVSITSSADVPDVRVIRVNPVSTSLLRTI